MITSILTLAGLSIALADPDPTLDWAAEALPVPAEAPPRSVFLVGEPWAADDAQGARVLVGLDPSMPRRWLDILGPLLSARGPAAVDVVLAQDLAQAARGDQYTTVIFLGSETDGGSSVVVGEDPEKRSKINITLRRVFDADEAEPWRRFLVRDQEEGAQGQLPPPRPDQRHHALLIDQGLSEAGRLERALLGLTTLMQGWYPGSYTVIGAPESGAVVVRLGIRAWLVRGGAVHELRALDELPRDARVSNLEAAPWEDGSRAYLAAHGKLAQGDEILLLRAQDPLEAQGLVRVDDLMPGAMLDMRYTTPANFTGVQLYPEHAACYLRPKAAASLVQANDRLSEVGLRLRLYDCYRPVSAQRFMYEVNTRPGFVASPSGQGSVHNRGAAVDVGLVDAAGHDVPLPTDHDAFVPEAAAAAAGLPWGATANRRTLQEAMRRSGFSTIRLEWWHFDGSGGTELPMDFDFPEWAGPAPEKPGVEVELPDVQTGRDSLDGSLSGPTSTAAPSQGGGAGQSVRAGGR